MVLRNLIALKDFSCCSKCIREFVNANCQAVIHEFNFDATGLASEVYVYRVESNDPSSGSGQSFIEAKKMIILK